MERNQKRLNRKLSSILNHGKKQFAEKRIFANQSNPINLKWEVSA